LFSILTTSKVFWQRQTYTLWETRKSEQLSLRPPSLCGGCSAQTAGGIKVVRWAILSKQLKNENQ